MSDRFGALDDSPARIRALLTERGLALKKRWGQNFMVSPAARRRIVDLLDPGRGERVWEIGPGLGSITAGLLDRGALVTVFEVDFGLMAVIRERFGSRVEVVAGDAVKTIAARDDAPERIVGNLPYRSAAAIITTILESPTLLATVSRMVFTVQREMALRMVARTGGSDYSPFSVICSVSAQIRLAGDLSRGNFHPPPDVVSSIVAMEPVGIDPETQRTCSVCARSLFAQRRKTIANNAGVLAGALGRDLAEIRDAFEAVGINPASRAQEIPPADFLALARFLTTAGA